MEQTNQTFLATEKVDSLMRKYAVPCIISLLVGALYNIVDQIFIANADYLGSYGNAANTVVFPLTVIALAIAVMIGDGCCAFVSLSLGKKHPEDADLSVGNAIVLTVLGGIVLCALYILFQDTIISMFGGTVNAETFRHSKEYFFYISLGIPFYMFGQAMNPVIRADGSPRFAMVSTLAGAVVNIILDPIFIFIFKWGMMGAAAFLIVELLPIQLIAIFGAANESAYYTDFAVKAFRIYLCMIIFACVNKATFIFLQAMGKAAASTALSMIREIIFGVGFAILLPKFFGLDGVLYSMPVSDILTAVVSAIIIVFTYKELHSDSSPVKVKSSMEQAAEL